MGQLNQCIEVASWDPTTLFIWFLLTLVIIVFGLALVGALWMLREQSFAIARLVSHHASLQESKNKTDAMMARSINQMAATLEIWKKKPGSFFGYGPD